MERFDHRFLANSQKQAIRHCGRRDHAECLSRQWPFAETIRLAQYVNGCFSARLRDYGESYFACLDVEHCIRPIPGAKIPCFILKSTDFLPSLMVAKKV